MQHNFVTGPNPEACVVPLQDSEECGMDQYAPVHRPASLADAGSVGDAPADDEGLARADAKALGAPWGLAPVGTVGETYEGEAPSPIIYGSGSAPVVDTNPWADMAERLADPSCEVCEGPWPVRKYDVSNGNTKRLISMQYSLMMAAVEFCVTVSWHGVGQVALVTWGDWFGWSGSAIAESIIGAGDE